MRLTPSEASTKRCQESYPASDGISSSASGEASFISYPVASAPYGAGAAFAATKASFAPMNCIGPRCMAWRWLRGETTDDGDPLGFCGKAGPT